MNQKEFIDRYNDLTGVFLRGFSERKQAENIAFSPFSILSLLSIFADATAGSTRQEVQDLLYGDVPQQGFPEQLKAVRDVLTREKDYSRWLGYEDPYHGKLIPDTDKHLDTANAVIVRQEYSDTIRPEFRKLLSDLYDGILISSLVHREFQLKRSPESVREMLSLLESITNSESVLVMLNTVFFHAMWQYPYLYTLAWEKLHPDKKIVRASYDLLDGPGGAEQVTVEMTEELRTEMNGRVTALLDLLSRPEDAILPAYLTRTPDGEARECSDYCIFHDLCYGVIGRMLGDAPEDEGAEPGEEA